jgi:cell division control protein 12
MKFSCKTFPAFDTDRPLRSLKPLDIEIMKRLGTRVNLIPVIAKADTLTQSDLAVFKQRVSSLVWVNAFDVDTQISQIREVIVAQGIRVYQPPIEADDEQSAELARILINTMPFSVIGGTEDVRTGDGRVVKGREYLWGVAEGIVGGDSPSAAILFSMFSAS